MSDDLEVLEEGGVLIFRAKTVKAAQEVERNLPLPEGKRLAWKAWGWMEEPREQGDGFRATGEPADMTGARSWAKVQVTSPRGQEWIKARFEDLGTGRPFFFEARTDNLAWRI